jgi:UDP-N-acetylglucosamine:LPS N-acetylglucosamine transferase
LDARSFPEADGLRVVSYLPNLHRHLAVCDVAVVQGGLTTCMELTANRRPFVYVPLQHHFEQQFHVRHRLDRYGAGTCLPFDAFDPESLSQAVVDAVQRPLGYLPVDAGGAARAGSMLADLL